MNDQAFDNVAPNKRLSKEELLAGKCAPDETVAETDPRFKSPDEVLLQLVAQKRASGGPAPELTIQHGFRRGETTLGQDVLIERAPETKDLDKELKVLKQRYETDKKRWQEYEERILDWKTQVMTVIENIREENNVEALKREIEMLKEINRKKDEEIRTLAENIKSSSKKR